MFSIENFVKLMKDTNYCSSTAVVYFTVIFSI
ncbi:hypothetical protein T06_14778 [Trichinella sp. T6]|nr:hypothetical protein T06_14778 [Trichinella sp. T6]